MKKDKVQQTGSSNLAMPEAGLTAEHLHALATEARIPLIALGVCLIRSGESGPILRELLSRAADGATLTEAEDLLLFRGLYILSGMRDPLAFKPLLRLLRRPDDELETLLGDSITESLSRIVTSVFDGDADALMAAIADRSIDEYVRSALFGAATYLTWEGRIDSERFIAFLERFHQERLAAAKDMAWIGWMEAIALLPLPEMTPLIDEAFQNGWIDNDYLDRADFDEDLAEAIRAPADVHRFQRFCLGYIEDVLVELEKFCDADQTDAYGRSSWEHSMDARPMPVTNPMRDIRRNDPCPCGSGKKAKKCCLSV